MHSIVLNNERSKHFGGNKRTQIQINIKCLKQIIWETVCIILQRKIQVERYYEYNINNVNDILNNMIIISNDKNNNNQEEYVYNIMPYQTYMMCNQCYA